MIDYGYRADYDYAKRIVKQESIVLDNKKYWISTVDLGIDHGYMETGIYWETMIFNEKNEFLYMARYSSREASERGHERMKESFLNKTIQEEM